MGLLYSIIVGAIAGWLAGKILKGKGLGLLMNIILGIVGGCVGGWIFGLLNITPDGGFTGNLVTSLIGAIVVLFIASKLKK